MSQPDRLTPSALGERLFALSEDLIAVADVRGRILRVNPAWQESLGWAPHELEGRSYLDFVHPTDRPAFGAAALRLTEPGERVSGAEARWRAADGSWRWLVWSARNEDGLVHGHARPADAVRETDRKLREIATHLREMLWLATPELGAIDWVSQACLHVWGRTPDELIADPAGWISDVHADDRERVLAALGTARAEPYEVQYRIVRRSDGAVRWMRSSGRPIPGSGAAPARVAGITEDVTEQVEHAESLRRQSAGHAAVAELGAAALEGREVGELIDRAVRALARIVGAELSAAWEHAGDERFVPAASAASDGLSVPEIAGDSLLAYALRSGAPVVCDDIDAERRFAVSEAARGLGARSGLVVPVAGDGRPWGVLGVISLSPRAFAAEDVHFVQSLAHVLGDALERRARDEALRVGSERLRASEQRFRGVVETAAEAIWLTDADGRTVFVNPRSAELTGRPLDELEALDLRDVVHPEDAAVVEERIAARRRGESGEYEIRLVRPDGEVRWIRISYSPLRDDAGRPAGSLAMASDITERRHAEQEARMAREHFESAFLHAPIGMGVVGPDGRWLAVNAALCRMTGFDEGELEGAPFDALTPPEHRDEAAERFAGFDTGEVRTLRVERPVLHRAGHELWCVISATATYTDDGELRSVVVQYEDVTERRRTEERLRAQVEELAWVERIRSALDDDAFVLVAQPIVDAHSGECLREELLIRMRLGTRLIEPAAFLPIAERHGVVQAIDVWVARRAAAIAAAGRPVQINVSARSAGDDRYLAALEQALATHATPAGALTVELTETALADDMEQAQRFASRLERLGVPLALDDFGVGWASLQYLKTLPGLRYLKIDAEFVRDVVSEERSRALVRAIVELARSFGQETIAEGVEDAATRDLLRRLGVDCLQGYLLGRPEPL